MSGPSWLQTTETPLKPDETHKTGGDLLKGYSGSYQNWITSWIIKSQNGRKRDVKTSLPASPHPPRPFSSGGRCHAQQGPGSWFLHLYTQSGRNSFSLQSHKTGFWPQWTVVIGSHWSTVLPLNQSCDWEKQNPEKRRSLPFRPQGWSHGEGWTEMSDPPGRVSGRQAHCPQDSQLSGRAKQTRLYIRNTDAHRLKKLVNAKWIINSVSEQKK